MKNGSMQKIAVVTGANKGIGFEIAKQLSELGIRCYLAGRSEERVASAISLLRSQKLDVHPLVLDITSQQSVSDAPRYLSDREDKLDILVNNAAICIEPYGTRPSEQVLDDWRITFDTNIFGTVAVTQVFLPLLRKSPAGRIVNVSSLLGSITTHSDPASYAYSDMFKSLPAYSASKSALNSWIAHLAYELRKTPIKVNSAHPGYTRTDMNYGEGDQPAAEGARTSVRLALLGDGGPKSIEKYLE
ncbi:SDR family oxidoreductase [Breoghania sp.]|uniref:SDR family oxidoreductase n=1 Tax=Breoghania sp. TaxID=2065378 RepID=UPI00263992B2|nr:SDR family oxidoreductase [Breoghania sp.]MDJ0930699.1 SDR family oxidoreductase [Breoghania sp.]